MAPSSMGHPGSTSTTGRMSPTCEIGQVREVWSWNLDDEFRKLVAAVASGGRGGAIVAVDMEFPGFIRQEPRADGPDARAARYQALRENVNRLQPIQLGIAVAGSDGLVRGVWSFNFNFNLDVDLHTEKSVAFLRDAGIDFTRLAAEGIVTTALGLRLAGSRLINNYHDRASLPQWVTFSGSYDLGYLLKLLTANRPLPKSSTTFDAALAAFCPKRHELRDDLPYGSLDMIAKKHGLPRRGAAHTAGSDALLTLELFLRVVGNRKSYDDGSASSSAASVGEPPPWIPANNNAWNNSWALAQSMVGWENPPSPKPCMMSWHLPAHKMAWWRPDLSRDRLSQAQERVSTVELGPLDDNTLDVAGFAHEAERAVVMRAGGVRAFLEHGDPLACVTPELYILHGNEPVCGYP